MGNIEVIRMKITLNIIAEIDGGVSSSGYCHYKCKLCGGDCITALGYCQDVSAWIRHWDLHHPFELSVLRHKDQ